MTEHTYQLGDRVRYVGHSRNIGTSRYSPAWEGLLGTIVDASRNWRDSTGVRWDGEAENIIHWPYLENLQPATHHPTLHDDWQ